MNAQSGLGYMILYIERGIYPATKEQMAVLKKAFCALVNRGFDGPIVGNLDTIEEAVAAANESLTMLRASAAIQPEWMRARLEWTERDETPYLDLLSFHGIPQRVEA